MRISTMWSQQLSVMGMLEQQAKLNDTQLKLSTGKKYLTPSENSVDANYLINLDQQIKATQQYQTNADVAKQRLELEITGLSSATEVLQRIRELGVQGLNGGNNAENRKQISLEMDELNKQLLTIANTQNANGDFIFSGFQTDQPAFSANNASNAYGYQYNGDANQRNILIGQNNRQVTDGDSGEAVFGSVSTVAAGSLAAGSIDNIFQAVAKFSADLKNNTPNSGSLADIDKTMTRIGTIQASVGARLNALDSQQALNDQYIMDHQRTASEVGDLDYAEALSKFSLQQIALQASQQAFTQVKDLSLFKYM